MSEKEIPLTIMAVHAHPDDEATSGGASLAYYRGVEGVQTIVVTCTDGAEGEMHDADRDPVEAAAKIAEIRYEEMANAARILNLSAHEWLGYRDSGMVGTPANENPASFHKADFNEATGRLVRLVRRYRPQVLITYNSFGGYGHPDHIQAHKITSAAFEYAADLDRYSEEEFGPAWQPLKLYTAAFSRAAWQSVWHSLRQNGEDWPFQPPKKEGEEETEAAPKKEFPPEFGTPDSEITTIIDVKGHYRTAIEALMVHRTQINPESPFWKLRSRFADTMMQKDYFILFKSKVPAQRPEYDLFAGLRD